MSLYELEMAGDATEVIEILRRTDKPEVKRRAAAVLGNLDPDEETREDVVDELVALARRADDAVASAAIDALDRYGPEAVGQFVAAEAEVDPGGADWVRAEAFAETLSADLPETRMAAASALGQIGSAEAVGPLAEALDDPDPRVRARVARALGRIGDPRAADALIDRTDDEVAVRREVAEALGSVGTEPARAALESLARDEDPVVRRSAVSVLGEFESAAPVPELGRALGDGHHAVRRAAVYSLLDLLANVPASRSHAVRSEVVDELAGVEDERVVDALTELLTESTEAPRRRNAAWLLGRVTGDDVSEDVAADAVAALAVALGDEDNATRQFAATSLVGFDDETVEPELLEVVDDAGATDQRRAQAVFVLGKVGGERAREELDLLLDDTESEQIRKQAFAALSKLGGR